MCVCLPNPSIYSSNISEIVRVVYIMLCPANVNNADKYLLYLDTLRNNRNACRVYKLRDEPIF